MSAIRDRKTKLKFETSATYQGRPIMGEADQFSVYLRLKGTRTRYEVPWEAAYILGAKLLDRQRRDEKHRRGK